MNSKRIIVGPLETNCFILWSNADSALIIDPGADADRIVTAITELKIIPSATVLTHGHYDHIGAAKTISERYKISIYAHPLELDMLKNPELNFSAYSDNPISVFAEPLSQQLLDEIGIPLKLLELPGHTPGGIGLFNDEVLISGDTVFAGGGVGRTDLPGADFNTLKDSIEKIIELPDELVLMPGHGGRSILGREKQSWRNLLGI